jgi:hypothetical protein
MISLRTLKDYPENASQRKSWCRQTGPAPPHALPSQPILPRWSDFVLVVVASFVGCGKRAKRAGPRAAKSEDRSTLSLTALQASLMEIILDFTLRKEGLSILAETDYCSPIHSLHDAQTDGL